jgi:hypothetical protein
MSIRQEAIDSRLPSNSNSNMGPFSLLPPEIRAQIWEHSSIAIQPGLRFTFKGTEDNLRLLRTCRSLYNEVSSFLYERVTLTFHLSPLVHRNSGSWIYVTTSAGARWNIDPDKAQCDHFRVLPYKRLKAVKFEIQAPDRKDPGQVILLWTRIYDLLNLLSKVEEFPNIELCLRETHAKWSTNGTPNRSVPFDSNHPDEDSYPPDFEVILLPFCQLRNVRSTRIISPKRFRPKGRLLHDIARRMEAKESFGKVRKNHAWDDLKVREALELTQFQ